MRRASGARCARRIFSALPRGTTFCRGPHNHPPCGPRVSGAGANALRAVFLCAWKAKATTRSGDACALCELRAADSFSRCRAAGFCRASHDDAGHRRHRSLRCSGFAARDGIFGVARGLPINVESAEREILLLEVLLGYATIFVLKNRPIAKTRARRFRRGWVS